jgi:hypothetical protein
LISYCITFFQNLFLSNIIKIGIVLLLRGRVTIAELTANLEKNTSRSWHSQNSVLLFESRLRGAGVCKGILWLEEEYIT